MLFAETVRNICNNCIDKNLVDRINQRVRIASMTGKDKIDLSHFTKYQQKYIQEHTDYSIIDNIISLTMDEDLENAENFLSDVKVKIMVLAKRGISNTTFDVSDCSENSVSMFIDMIEECGFQITQTKTTKMPRTVFIDWTHSIGKNTFGKKIRSIMEKFGVTYEKEVRFYNNIRNNIRKYVNKGEIVLNNEILDVEKYLICDFDEAVAFASDLMAYEKFNIVKDKNVTISWKNIDINDQHLPDFTREIVTQYKSSSSNDVSRRYDELKKLIKRKAEDGFSGIIIYNDEIVSNFGHIFNEIQQMLKDDGFKFVMDNVNNCVIEW